MPWVLAVAAVGMQALGAFEQYQQGQNARIASIRQAEVNEQQARTTEYNARADITVQDYKASHLLSRIQAVGAASGVDETTGSTQLQTVESADQQRLNDMYEKHAADVQATGLDYQANLTKLQGQEEATAALNQAFISIFPQMPGAGGSGGNATGGLVSKGIDAYGSSGASSGAAASGASSGAAASGASSGASFFSW